MRVLQLIDSLETGGAEKMAVNYANALSRRAAFSGLIAQRKEGGLKQQIDSKVGYLFLNKKHTFDIAALLRLRDYCQFHKVEYIQAHSSSFFLAALLKLTMPRIKIIWHDHYGLSDFLGQRKTFAIKIVSVFFEGIIAVNDRLQKWAECKLYCGKTIYLPNFTIDAATYEIATQLRGKDGKRILCLANLREQKNHLFLIEVAKRIKEKHPDWTFHLVGKDFGDEYSESLKLAVKESGLETNVFFYGAQNDISHIISQADIALLTSRSEGLPVALLEYGLNKKPVVVTAVGEIPTIVTHGQNGFIVGRDDTDGFYNSLSKLIESDTLRAKLGEALQQTINENHSEAAVIDKLLNWL